MYHGVFNYYGPIKEKFDKLKKHIFLYFSRTICLSKLKNFKTVFLLLSLKMYITILSIEPNKTYKKFFF